MKKKFKKAVAVVLTVAMAVSVGAPAFAAEEKVDSIIYDGVAYIQNDKIQGLYESENGNYVMKYRDISADLGRSSGLENNDVLIPMERVDISFDDEDAVNTFINRDDIPKEAVASFQEKYKAYQNNEDSTVVPSVSAFLARANGEPDDILYPEENMGCEMMTYVFYYGPLSSDWFDIESGLETKSVLDTVFEIALLVGSEVSTTVNFLVNGETLLEEFAEALGINATTLSANVADYYRGRVHWDQIEQYTMRNFAGEWQTGLVTYHVDLYGYDTDIYMKNSGKFAKTLPHSVSESVESPDYRDPWQKAYDNGRYTEYQTVKWAAGPIECEFS